MISKPLAKTQRELKIAFLILIFVFPGSLCRAQNQNRASVDDLLAYSSEIYGTNDVLVNGWKYYPEHYNAKGNPYFMDEEWMIGRVSIQGKSFKHVELLYDVVNDELILRQMLNNGSLVFVMLNKDFISSFTLTDHHFVHSKELESPALKSGFYEMVYDGELRFIIRYDKAFVNQYTAQSPHGSFSNQRAANYILNNGRVTRISSKRSLLNYFSAHKKQIRSFLREHRINYKKASTDELHQLMTYCDQL